MSLNKWRIVEDDDDGHTIFQCLKCRQQWDAHCMYSRNQFIYCPWCGVKFEGELKWQSEYDSPESKRRYLKFATRRANDSLSKYDWIVESKIVWKNDTIADLNEKLWEECYHGEYCHNCENKVLRSQNTPNRKLNALNLFRNLIEHADCDSIPSAKEAFRLVLYERSENYSDKKLLAVCKEFYPVFEKNLTI